MSKENTILRKDLKRIEIEINPKGFVMWIKEPGRKGCRHWLMDGSCLYETGEISLGRKIDHYNFKTVIVGNRFEKRIRLIDKRIKTKKQNPQ